MKSPRAILWLLAWLPASCATHADKSDPSSTPPAHKPLSERIEQKNGYKQDASGNWVPVNDQRSSFETKGASPYFQGQAEKKSYATTEVTKKSWWGTKTYEHQKYAGNTDASRFQKKSPLSTKGAHEAGTAANIPAPYQTGSYATSAARESAQGEIAKPSDTQTDIRRKVYQAPEIIDWKEQRSLSVSQSKGILGR